MRMRVLFSLLGLVSAAALAQPSDVPLTNWTVPPYRTSNASGGISTMADLSPGIGFVAVTPCRIVDTRGGGVFSGTYGPPALVGNAARSFDINSAPHCPGIPAGAESYSLNFTVIAAAGVFQNAFLTAWPTGGAQPVVSTLNFNAGQLEANAAIVPAGTNGSINVFVNAPGHLLIDINGYFTEEYNPGVSFHAVSNSATPAILAENTSSASEATAIQAVITTTTPGPTGVAAVKGFNQGTNATGVGVWGKHNGGGWGVLGESQSGFGVVATAGGTGSNSAVYAVSHSTGVTSGVYGAATATDSRSYGVFGESESPQPGSAGVLGIDRDGPTGRLLFGGRSGIRGESLNGRGIIGQGALTGVEGNLVPQGSQSYVASGSLGHFSGGVNYGVYSDGNAHVQGTFTASANKGFVQPHPHDASKEIRYISLEGPHTEVYFRGTAQVSQGVTRIAIPQHFRFVADPATYSTLVTPVGAMATVAVLDEGPEGIVVQASRNVKVHYVVYAEREAVRNPDPIIENVHFRSDPGRDFLANLPDTFRQLMIQNGTLNADGTANLETAKRLGWDKEWEKRARPTPQPAE